MNKHHHMICLWSGILFGLMFTVGVWFVALFVPPPLPTASAGEITAFYTENAGRIRAGMLIAMAGAGLWIPWSAAIAMQTARIEGSRPIMSVVQMACAGAQITYLIIPMMIFMAATFRPERHAELIYLFNDFGWLIFVMVFSTATIQTIAMGLPMLADRSVSPVYPRWAGYFNIWCALLYTPGGLAIFFKTGPFAWNGLLAFWLVLGVIGIWLITMFVLTRRAILQEFRTT